MTNSYNVTYSSILGFGVLIVQSLYNGKIVLVITQPHPVSLEYFTEHYTDFLKKNFSPEKQGRFFWSESIVVNDSESAGETIENSNKNILLALKDCTGKLVASRLSERQKSSRELEKIESFQRHMEHQLSHRGQGENITSADLLIKKSVGSWNSKKGTAMLPIIALVGLCWSYSYFTQQHTVFQSIVQSGLLGAFLLTPLSSWAVEQAKAAAAFVISLAYGIIRWFQPENENQGASPENSAEVETHEQAQHAAEKDPGEKKNAVDKQLFNQELTEKQYYDRTLDENFQQYLQERKASASITGPENAQEIADLPAGEAGQDIDGQGESENRPKRGGLRPLQQVLELQAREASGDWIREESQSPDIAEAGAGESENRPKKGGLRSLQQVLELQAREASGDWIRKESQSPDIVEAGAGQDADASVVNSTGDLDRPTQSRTSAALKNFPSLRPLQEILELQAEQASGGWIREESQSPDIAEAGAEQNVAVAEQDVAVAEQNVAVAEQDVAVAEQDVARAEQDVAVAEQNVAVAEQDVAVAEQNVAVAEQDVARAEQDVARAEQDVARAGQKEDTSVASTTGEEDTSVASTTGEEGTSVASTTGEEGTSVASTSGQEDTSVASTTGQEDGPADSNSIKSHPIDLDGEEFDLNQGAGENNDSRSINSHPIDLDGEEDNDSTTPEHVPGKTSQR